MKTIITGTSQGLGFHLAELYAPEDSLIVINRTATKRRGEIVCDLRDEKSVDSAGRKLLTRLGKGYEVRFVLNAADYGEDVSMADVEPLTLGKQMYANVFAQLGMVERLLKAGFDVELIAVSSGMGSTADAPEAYHYGYCASKSALNLCVRLLASQHSQLRYMLVDPGWMRTQMGGQSATQDPAAVASRLKAAADLDASWNRSDGLVEVNSGKVVPW